ncbi:MAG: hypothetical protein ACK5RG_18125 [Cyclobacteriaceae bacterium]|jgi:hypothetical protein
MEVPKNQQLSCDKVELSRLKFDNVFAKEQYKNQNFVAGLALLKLSVLGDQKQDRLK